MLIVSLTPPWYLRLLALPVHFRKRPQSRAEVNIAALPNLRDIESSSEVPVKSIHDNSKGR